LERLTCAGVKKKEKGLANNIKVLKGILKTKKLCVGLIAMDFTSSMNRKVSQNERKRGNPRVSIGFCEGGLRET